MAHALETITIRYEFEAFNERTGYSEGEEFTTLAKALDAFNKWEIREGEAASSKRIAINIYAYTIDGEIDLLAQFTALDFRL